MTIFDENLEQLIDVLGAHCRDQGIRSFRIRKGEIEIAVEMAIVKTAFDDARKPPADRPSLEPKDPKKDPAYVPRGHDDMADAMGGRRPVIKKKE